MSALSGSPGGIDNTNGIEVTIRDCVFYSTVHDDCFNHTPGSTALNYDFRFYRNRTYTTYNNGEYAVGFDISNHHSVVTGLVEDNTFMETGSGEGIYSMDPTNVTGVTFRRNQYKHAWTNGFIQNSATGGFMTLAAWQASAGTPDADASTADPGWTTPGSGVFDAGVFALCDSTGIILSLDGGSITASPSTVAQNASQIDTYQLHNITTTTLTTGADEVAVSGSGSYVGTGSDPAAQIMTWGDHFQFTVSRTTSAAGATTYGLSTTHDGTGSPFTVTVAFTVTASSGVVAPGSARRLLLSL